eukprot:6387170-Prymnesium_polylepis.1
MTLHAWRLCTNTGAWTASALGGGGGMYVGEGKGVGGVSMFVPTGGHSRAPHVLDGCRGRGRGREGRRWRCGVHVFSAAPHRGVRPSHMLDGARVLHDRPRRAALGHC